MKFLVTTEVFETIPREVPCPKLEHQHNFNNVFPICKQQRLSNLYQ